MRISLGNHVNEMAQCAQRRGTAGFLPFHNLRVRRLRVLLELREWGLRGSLSFASSDRDLSDVDLH